MDLVVSFLGNRHYKNLCVLAGVAEEPLKNEYVRFTEEFSTPNGVKDYFVEIGQPAFVETHFANVLDLMFNATKLRRCGFLFQPSEHMLELEVKEQQQLAEVTLELIRNMWAEEWLTSLLWCYRPPYCFASLLSSSVEVQQETLRRLQTLWVTLATAELEFPGLLMGRLLSERALVAQISYLQGDLDRSVRVRLPTRAP